MKREGSPWTGLWAVVLKELADHLGSARMQLLEGLIFLTAFGATYTAVRQLKATVAEDPFVYLKLFTTSQEPLPSFVAFLGFFLPLAAIALGFDSINGEHNRRTLSRVLAQPIYRDALLVGKFLAGMFTLGISLLALWLLVTGMGLLVLGVVPSGEEVGRGLLFLLTSWAYAGIWLALAMAFSVVFRQPATSALAAMAVWLFFAVFYDIVVQVIAQAVRPVYGFNPLEQLAQARVSLYLSRLSPNTLFAEIVLALLNPEVRALGPVFITQLEGAVLGTPLPVGQSLLLAWPQFTGMLAALLLLFAGTYVLFQRQEVRA
ncbi:MAG: ABC transporter permease [Armatimonadota bacterium]|nr:ABC transporter permease [Armatimonadota bacterium]MDR7401012.1 ABC transporter permease [Armatimonadota bacterium]MDR7403220.1 ABC transporter permease [Armatimonadota bacterium]MDR7436723.1 ABC transporter permease [Armatimonadota bacterium]MDR7471205.1 ABC transporter permease [Armatimonadota bacterium]